MITLVNGKKDTKISVNDRGLQFGDGLFETMRIIDGIATDLDEHLDRMRLGCERLGIEFPAVATWREDIGKACKYMDTGILKLIITRGEAEFGLRIKSDCAHNRVVKLIKLPDKIRILQRTLQKEGIKMQICKTRLSCNPATSGLKSLSWLEPALAHRELKPEAHEGLMLNYSGDIIEGISSNFFALDGNKLITPDLTLCGLSGIRRSKIMAKAKKLGLKVLQTRMRPEDLERFDTWFISNSFIGIHPVKQIDRIRKSINHEVLSKLI